MTERIDHAREAQEILREYPLGKMEEGTWAAAVAAEAQVHATLALVEQQRVANLIALYRVVPYDLGIEELADWSRSALEALIKYRDGWGLQPDIAAALGIEVTP